MCPHCEFGDEYRYATPAEAKSAWQHRTYDIWSEPSMSEELKACPFCGGKAELLTMRSKGVKVYGVFCRADLDQECQHGHFIDNYGTESEAIAAWNKRSE